MKSLAIGVLAACVSTLAFSDEKAAPPELTAPQIVAKNVTARGGLEAWQKIQTMVWLGHIDSANTPTPSVPFVLERKRPDKTRFEITAQNEIFVRMYDGIHGWKLRPTRGGRPEVQPYTPEELKFARDGEGMDGPLMEYQAKRVAVALEGTDEVEGHKAYRLRIKLPSGSRQHVWIDAQTLLETKSDRESRNAFGQSGTVTISYRDYRTVGGLQIPFIIETGVGTGKATDKMVIDKVLLNVPLDDRMFAKPWVPSRGNIVAVDTEARRPAGPAIGPAASRSPERPGLSLTPAPGGSGNAR
jgi:hypothetical protein